MAVAVALALAVLALGFPASASPGAPTPVGHEWSQVENHGTSGAPIDTYWLGTTGTQALELKVNGARVLRLEPPAGSPNVIGGYSGNSVTSGADDATIGGGGSSTSPNVVTDDGGTIGGGRGNWAGDDDQYLQDAQNATVGGGIWNHASGDNSVVGGGAQNWASDTEATVGGGAYNRAKDNYDTVGGGYGNVAGTGTGGGFSATVGGGDYNTASGDYATVGGGGRSVPWGDPATANRATDDYDTVGGGGGNHAGTGTNAATYATICGGSDNEASDHFDTVGGGHHNIAQGPRATVPGGSDNSALGAYSFAAGRQAKANHDGSFVWADSNGKDLASTAANEFSVRSTGGARFVSGIDGAGVPNAGVTLAAGGNAWAPISDRNVKANFTEVDGRDVLQRLASVPVETWNLKSQDASIRHMGPMAQDFYAAFGLGESETAITTVDADGVALAAIQGLYGLSQEQGNRIQALEEENASLNQRLDSLEARVSALEGGTGAGGAVSTASSSGVPALWPVLGGGLALVLVGLVLAQRRLLGGRR